MRSSLRVLLPHRPLERARRRDRGRRVRRAGATTAIVIVAALVPAPAAGQVARQAEPTDVDATIGRLRREADELATRYFDALAELTSAEDAIDGIERRLPDLHARLDALRDVARVRAVAAYKRSRHQLASVIDAESPLDAARRIQWLGLLNARDADLSADLRATTEKLDAQRSALRATRAAAAEALDDVRAQGEAIDALLLEAEARRRNALGASTADDGTSSTTAPPGGAPTPDPTTPRAETVTSTTTTLLRPVTTTRPPGTTQPTSTTRAPSPTATTTTTTAPPPSPGTPELEGTGVHPRHDEPFLVCTRAIESSGNYAAYNPAGPYMGAYQFLQTTWNSTANHAGRPELIGTAPHAASEYDQDDLAWALYLWQGSRPWGGRCD